MARSNRSRAKERGIVLVLIFSRHYQEYFILARSNRSRANEREKVSNPNILQTVLGFFLAWLGPLGVELRRKG